MAGPIAIAVVADVAKARAGLNGVEGDLNGFGAKASKFGAVAKAGFLVAGAAAVGFAVSAVKSASDAQQSVDHQVGRFGRRKARDEHRAASEQAATIRVHLRDGNPPISWTPRVGGVHGSESVVVWFVRAA